MHGVNDGVHGADAPAPPMAATGTRTKQGTQVDSRTHNAKQAFAKRQRAQHTHENKQTSNKNARTHARTDARTHVHKLRGLSVEKFEL